MERKSYVVPLSPQSQSPGSHFSEKGLFEAIYWTWRGSELEKGKALLLFLMPLVRIMPDLATALLK